MNQAWQTMLPADPLPWLLASDEPAARWVALVELLDRPSGDADVRAAHEAVLADEGTRELLDRLPDWEQPQQISGHDAPAFGPNLLHLLADMGVAGADDQRIPRLLDRLLAHADDEGRFAMLGAPRGRGEPRWGALLCDTHAIADVLGRYGRVADPRVRRALARAEEDLHDTAQGRAWPCRPDDATGFRGPGRRGDVCPLVTLEALRALARLPEVERAACLIDVARVSLCAWRERGTEKPYLFGHGIQFKTVKWPPTWYGAYLVLDVLGRYPALWCGAGARPEDRRALAEMAACLVAYNVAPDGVVIPRSVRQGFGSFSFGQKKLPSAWATARLYVVLRRLGDLAGDVAAVDVAALGSSKGGTGTARPPRGTSRATERERERDGGERRGSPGRVRGRRLSAGCSMSCRRTSSTT